MVTVNYFPHCCKLLPSFIRRWIVLIVTLILLSTLTLLVIVNDRRKEVTQGGQDDDVLSDQRQQKGCTFSGIKDLAAALENSKSTPLPDCLRSLDRVFELTVRTGTMDIPKGLQSTILGWLGGNKKLFQQVWSQKVVEAYNRVTKTTTTFNPLRASRPMPKSTVDPRSFIEQLIQEKKDSCDFCNYTYRTAYDRFGRLESTLAATSANVFKLFDSHSLVFPKNHNALNLSLEEFTQVFHLAQSWFGKVHAVDPLRTHPQMIYDSMAHAGASQVHPHMHMFMGDGRYFGQFRALQLSSDDFFRRWRYSYFSAYAKIHLSLGLAVRIDSDTLVIAPIDSHKDSELLVLSSRTGRQWIRAFYAVYRTFIDELGVFCWSGAFAWPPVEGDGGLPSVGRLGSRGSCQSLVSDTSSLELYLVYNVNSNPFKTIKAFAKTWEAMEKTDRG